MPLDVAQLGESPSGRAPGVPYSPVYDDLYHAAAGAAEQTQYVFLRGNGLPGRWQGRQQFVIVETGFGLGNNFLQTWAAWRQDPQRCRHLFFVSIEKHPLRQADLARVHAQGSPMAQRLVKAWPVLTPGLHTLHFEDETEEGLYQVTLILGLGDVADILPSLVLQADAFYLDGFAPAKNPDMWDEALLSRLGRLAAPGCTAATWSVARSVRDGLTQAGFTVKRAPGFASKRDMLEAVFEPRHVPAPPTGGFMPAPPPGRRRAVIVGAGLAGCVAAYSLCREGWQVTLVDRQAGPAQEASGNPGGMFHAILHGEDGVHARAHRAAALTLSASVSDWIQRGELTGQLDGLLRLDPKQTDDTAQALIDKLGLPQEYVRWLPHAQVQELSGLSVASGGWLFQQGGWLHPAGLAALLLKEAQKWADHHGQTLTYRWNQVVKALKHEGDEWALLVEADGPALARAPYVVLSNANGLHDLLSSLPDDHAVALPPLTPIRGQITTLSADATARHAQRPHLPVAGNGYALSLPDGRLLCGATTQHHDDCAEVRASDHAHNLNQAQKLGALLSPLDGASPDLQGRTAWRATTPDRLPLVGALAWHPQRLMTAGRRLRLDQTRMVPRERTDQGGLYVLSGLGSRGITWSMLAGQLLAHWMAGTPSPLPLDLRDALDPARFVARDHSKAAVSSGQHDS